jgi:anti-sigma B factor antagonist
MASLCLTDDLSIYHATAHKQQLLDALSTTDALDLDLSQVGHIDCAGLQLLILLKHEAQNTGKSLTISAHSQAVRDAIELCNLAAEFPLGADPVLIPVIDAS